MRIAVIQGDRIGVSVIESAISVVNATVKRVGAEALCYRYLEAGATFYLHTGNDIEPGGDNACADADAILLGTMDLPCVRWPGGTELVQHLRLREFFHSMLV